MNTKALVVVLILLFVLYIASAGLSFTRPAEATIGDSPVWLQALGDRVAQRQNLETDDISAAIPPDCKTALQGKALQLDVGAACTFIIKEARAPLRSLRLQADGASAVQVVFEPFDEQHLTAKKTLQGERNRMDVQIFAEGGQLSVACLLVACRVEVR
jgi:hypothetical protein